MTNTVFQQLPKYTRQHAAEQLTDKVIPGVYELYTTGEKSDPFGGWEIFYRHIDCENIVHTLFRGMRNTE